MTTPVDDSTARIRALAELGPPVEPGVEEAWIAEARRRHPELTDGRGEGSPGEQLFAKLRARPGR
jgi:hypothetical protein